MITLPIKKKWFDMILSGEKTEEYRDYSKYYFRRFFMYSGYMVEENGERKRREFLVRFRNGYRKDSPFFDAWCTVDLGTGKPEWGAEPDKTYYVLQIKEIIRRE